MPKASLSLQSPTPEATATLGMAGRVARVVDGWQAHFNSLDVSAEATALLADLTSRLFRVGRPNGASDLSAPS